MYCGYILYKPGQYIQYSNLLWAEWSRNWTLVAVRFSALIQTGPGDPPTVPPHLAMRLKKGRSYTSTPPLGLQGLF